MAMAEIDQNQVEIFKLAIQQARKEEAGRWAIDRHIPIVLIFAIVSSIFSGVWWVSALSGRVVTLETSRPETTEKLEKLTEGQNAINVHLGSIDATLSDVKEMLRGQRPKP